MAELPDVEGFRRFLARHAEGRRIAGVEVRDPEIVRNRSPGRIRPRAAPHPAGRSSSS
jgi:formamidopyrimidine-DNA glycosylase